MTPRRVRALLISAAGLSAALVLTALLLHLGGRQRVRAALERIRVAGDPVLPGDLSFGPPGEGLDPTRWIEAMRSFESEWYLHDVDQDLDGLLERARQGEFGAGHVEAFEQVRACLNHSSFDELWSSMQRNLDHAAELDACQRAAHRLLVLEGAEIETARDVRRYRAVDTGAELRGFLASGEIFPDPRERVGVFAANELLTLSAIQGALDGDLVTALQDLELSFECCKVAGEPLVIVHHQLWMAMRRASLDALRVVLSYSPPGLDMAPIRAWIVDSEGAEARLLRALKSERAIGNRLMQDFDRQVSSVARGPIDTIELFGYSIVASHDQATYLKWFEDALAWLAQPRDSAVRVPDFHGDRPWWAIRSAIICPRLNGVIEHTLALEASQGLALVALTAYEQGIEAARLEAAATLDPFDGQPLRMRLDPDGTLVLWSMGVDGVDDGGTDPHDVEQDIVWRVRLR